MNKTVFKEALGIAIDESIRVDAKIEEAIVILKQMAWRNTTMPNDIVKIREVLKILEDK